VLGILIDLIVLGLLIYVVNLLPIDAAIKQIIRVVVTVIAIIWLLEILVGGVRLLR